MDAVAYGIKFSNIGDEGVVAGAPVFGEVVDLEKQSLVCGREPVDDLCDQ